MTSQLAPGDTFFCTPLVSGSKRGRWGVAGADAQLRAGLLDDSIDTEELLALAASCGPLSQEASAAGEAVRTFRTTQTDLDAEVLEALEQAGDGHADEHGA